ncbi:O-antigen ligase family protein [Streptomyces sp. NPDC006458]|uniref:O-antigen ligase family protein n=1 Tax=Streptomyces sp. NPDC006458 TaxID=3154302 RepID=UPI0033B43570
MAPTLYGPERAAARPRILLGLVLVAAAMPVRFGVSAPLLGSVSVLDIMLCVAAASLAVGWAVRPLDIGYPRLFLLLCIPMAAAALSMLWSLDRGATFLATVVYAEGVIAYLFVVRELAGVSADRVMTYIRRYSYLLIIPAVLLLLRVPGFAPQDAQAPVGSDRYLSYYTRLSHPVLGPSNNLASVLALFVPILLYWGHTRHDRRCTVASYVTLIAVVCTLSRGIIAALLLAAGLAGLGYLVRNRQVGGRVIGKAVAALVTVVAAIVMLHQFNPDTREFFGSRFSPANVFVRTEFAVEAVGRIADRPVLGYGAGVAPGGIEDLARVHNTYLQQALNYGLLLGALVSLTLVGMALFFFSRWRTSPEARVVGFTLLAQLVVFAVESSFEGTVLRVLFYLSVGLLTALVRACEAQRAPVPRTDPADGAHPPLRR